MAIERSHTIVDCFIGLVAEHGVINVTLDQVATAAGVQRAVVRHYVGNKDSLVDHALRTLVERYTQLIRDQVGDEPTVEAILDMLFSRQWTHGTSSEDRALDELFQVAVRDSEIRQGLKSAYQLLIDELADAIHRAHAGLPRPECVERAYAVVCLAEHNSTLQKLGMAKRYTTTNRRAAEKIVG